MIDNRFVLSVEDDAFALQILKMQSGMLKLPFEVAVNGQEAYDKFVSKNGSITIVLMDLSIPVMDGFQSAEKMRQYEKDQGLQKCKIFAVSGDKEKAIQDKVLQCGMDGLIEQPLTAAKIKQCL